MNAFAKASRAASSFPSKFLPEGSNQILDWFTSATSSGRMKTYSLLSICFSLTRTMNLRLSTFLSRHAITTGTRVPSSKNVYKRQWRHVPKCLYEPFIRKTKQVQILRVFQGLTSVTSAYVYSMALRCVDAITWSLLLILLCCIHYRTFLFQVTRTV